MKKLVYLAAIAFAASMVACGGSKAEKATVDSDSILAAEAAAAVIEVVTPDSTDSANADTAVVVEEVVAETVE